MLHVASGMQGPLMPGSGCGAERTEVLVGLRRQLGRVERSDTQQEAKEAPGEAAGCSE